MRMRRTYKISAEEAAELREKLKTTKNANACRRMEAVALLGEGKTPEEVAAIKKFHPKYVRILGLLYHEKGLEAFSVDGRRGGNHQMMSREESEEFLRQFETAAESGKVITIEDIAKALNEKTGKQRKSRSTAYALMHRHGWRKLKPRSQHPKKASDEEIEASKKLTNAIKN
jgi:hypothetical protein